METIQTQLCVMSVTISLVLIALGLIIARLDKILEVLRKK